MNEYVCTGNPAGMFLCRFWSALVRTYLPQQTAMHDLSNAFFPSPSLELDFELQCPHVRDD